MSSFYLHPKNIHIMNSEVFYCPNPLDNEQCQGKYIKTRVSQTECVACMKEHGTILDHPFLNVIRIYKKKKFVILKEA